MEAKKYLNFNLLFGDYRNRKKWSGDAVTYAPVLDAYKTNYMQDELEDTLMGKISSSREDIKKALGECATKDIVYMSSRLVPISPSLQKRGLQLSNQLMLVKEKCSISVNDYLLVMTGGIGIPPKVVEEWSGIPMEKQEEIYNEIIEYLKRIISSYNTARAV